MLDYEKGDLVHYASRIDRTSHITGLVIDVEYLTKADDFLVYILWTDSDPPGRPQALHQKSCHKRNLQVLN
jgi:hypothetical protein